MIYEYAVDPVILSKRENIQFIMSSFGMDNGRYISDTNKGLWVNWVRQEINKLEKPVAKKALKTALESIVKRHRAIYKRNNTPANNWQELIEKTHPLSPYRGILVQESDERFNSDYLCCDDIELANNPIWQSAPSQTVLRNAHDMLLPAIPLLNISREVELVDRNFRFENSHGKPTNRFLAFLLIIAHHLNDKTTRAVGPAVKTITYHIGDEYYTEEGLAESKAQYLSPKLPDDIDVKFKIWPKSALHDRYILTDAGVLEYGYGLDESTEEGQTVTIKRLARDDHSRLRKVFTA